MLLTTPAVSPWPRVATLDGSGSFDPDPGGGIAKYRWEVVTGAYQWLAISHASERSPTASFEVPSRALADRFGPSIEFRLTVTDSGSPAASDSAFVVFTINQAPVVDIAVTAKLLDPDDHEGYDDNGNGEIDENSERYALEGVIDGPGERGNAGNEWHIRDGSLLVVDGSASSDDGGPLPDAAFSLERLYASDVPEVTDSLPGDTSGQKKLSTDEDPGTPGDEDDETVALLPYDSGDEADAYYLYYVLTVTDEDGETASAVAKILIRDHPADPGAVVGHHESDPGASDTASRRNGVQPAGENRYVISPEAAEDGVTLTATGIVDGRGRSSQLTHTWSGPGVDDGDSLMLKWAQARNSTPRTAPTASGDPLTVTYRGPRLSLAGSSTGTASFALPEVTAGTHYTVYVKFEVADEWGVSDSDVVEIIIRDGGDDLMAVAGPPQRVQPGGFVRLRGGFRSGLVSEDAISEVAHRWAYTGIETLPRTENRPPVTDVEAAEGFAAGLWFPGEDGAYHPAAGGRVKAADGRFPYFDAPRLGQFQSVKLFFVLTVGDGTASDTDTLVVTVVGEFFSGHIDGPDFCANLSLGGPRTHPFDSDGDGAADVCSLHGTRRFTVARQNALETLAALNPDGFADALFGQVDDPDTSDVDETADGTCATAPTGLGDSEDDLAEDVCGQRQGGFPPVRTLSDLPDPVDPAIAGVFFSGAITGPSFCANLSLGGPATYAHDRDGDGAADVCSLHSTRRVAPGRLQHPV